MKDAKYGFIYITTNLINGKKYIGQKMYNSRWKTYLGSGVILQKAIKKYGRQNFQREIIEECNNQDELNNREIYWINFYNAVINNEFYNVVEGGGVCPIQTEINSRSKRLICLNTLEIFDSVKLAMNKYGCFRKSITDCCNHTSHRTMSNEGKWLTWMWYEDYLNSSDEIVQNKLKRAEDGMRGSNNPFYGQKHSEETINYLKTSKQGISNKNKFKKVICLTTNMIFQSLKEAEEYYNLKSTILEACKGKNHYSGKYNGVKLVWMYYDEYLSNPLKAEEKLNKVIMPKNTDKQVKVKCINDNIIFDSISDAIKWCNMSGCSNISRCCSGILKSAGKHPITGEKLKWEYVS